MYGHPTLCLSIDLFRVRLLHLSATVNNAYKHLFESLLPSPLGISINQLIAVSISWILMIINYYLKFMLPQTFVYRFLFYFIIFHSLLLRCEIAGSYGNSIFKNWRTCQRVCQSSSTILHSQRQFQFLYIRINIF